MAFNRKNTFFFFCFGGLLEYFFNIKMLFFLFVETGALIVQGRKVVHYFFATKSQPGRMRPVASNPAFFFGLISSMYTGILVFPI